MKSHECWIDKAPRTFEVDSDFQLFEDAWVMASDKPQEVQIMGFRYEVDSNGRTCYIKYEYNVCYKSSGGKAWIDVSRVFKSKQKLLASL